MTDVKVGVGERGGGVVVAFSFQWSVGLSAVQRPADLD